MIQNEALQAEFSKLEALTTKSYANHIMMNSLKMLGSKKSESKDVLDEKDYKLLNSYKYPDRLIKMLEHNSARFEAEGSFGVSFAKLALQGHDITF